MAQQYPQYPPPNPWQPAAPQQAAPQFYVPPPQVIYAAG